MTLVENENMPGVEVPPHWHETEGETFYVLGGQVEFLVDEQRTLMTEGSVVYVPRGTRHGWKVVGDGPARMLLFLTPGGIDRMFAEIAELCGDRCAPKAPPMEKVMEISARHGAHVEPPPATYG